MTEQPSAVLLHNRTACVRAAFTAIPLDESALKDAICAYVDEAKNHGWHIERVIIEIKRISEVEDGPVYRARADPIQRHRARELVHRVVTWCIDRYFSTSLP
jgi:hypothetical protein